VGSDDVPGDGQPQAGSPEFAGPRLAVRILDSSSMSTRRSGASSSTPPGSASRRARALSSGPSSPPAKTASPARSSTEPSGAPSCHRTNTDSRIRQTATRVSDRSRYLWPADGIIVVGVREGRQQALWGGGRRDVPGPDIPGPIGRKEENYAAGSCGNRSGCRRCNPVAD